MKKNVKIIASLVRKAKKKLIQGKRDEALELMKKAVNIDDNSGVLVQIISVIGRKQAKTSDDEDTDQEMIETGDTSEEESVSVTDADSREPIPREEVAEAEEEIVEVDRAPVDETLTTGEEDDEAEPRIQNQERKTSMAADDRLQKLFEASDMEYEKGHQQKAIAYLKKARKLAPDDPEVTARIDLLKIRIKSANLVQIARKKLESGEISEAVKKAREAFRMLPDAPGIGSLLDDLEAYAPPAHDDLEIDLDETELEVEPEIEADYILDEDIDIDFPEEGSAQSFITEIRQLVQNNSLVAAAELAEKAYGIHPDDALLTEFVDNFRKLGLLE